MLSHQATQAAFVKAAERFSATAVRRRHVPRDDTTVEEVCQRLSLIDGDVIIS
jgi:hypothetical protein